MAASVENQPPSSDTHVEETKTLIAALNLLSRNLPLPPDVLSAVSSIYHAAHADPPSPTPESEAEAVALPGEAEEDGEAPFSGEEVVGPSFPKMFFLLILLDFLGHLFVSGKLSETIDKELVLWKFVLSRVV
ncbi:hypothetical protein BHM03_00044793 [Ensete ventricosum]|nr:hypothetical protein BHM03_00044793 [Ensete ventricosum]